MSQDPAQDDARQARRELPIERGFPIERVNEISEKEGRAKRYYRPVYTMHKWWARRNGSVFRAIALYSLLDDPSKVTVREPGANESLSEFGGGFSEIQALIDQVDLASPESLWELYPKDVQVEDTKVLDPFMGGGTSLVEASRFGAEVHGYDLNPVAWFVTKKELEAGQTSLEELDAAFSKLEDELAEELQDYYKTPCPNDDHTADVVYEFWVKQLDCVSCGHTVPLFNDYRIGNGRYDNKGDYNVLCPDCESVVLVDDWRSEADCSECGYEFIAEDGNAGGGDYTCTECGQQYPIIDAIEEQDGFETRLYVTEYYCSHCDEAGRNKTASRGYKRAEPFDHELFADAKQEWRAADELHDYVPSEQIPLGIKTDSAEFEGSIGGGFNVLRQGYSHWTDMFNPRQLLLLAKLSRWIDDVEDQNIKEYLLLALSESLNYNSMMIVYNHGANKATNIFKTNSFDAPLTPIENNVWGTRYGTGTFTKMWQMVRKGVEYAKAPTERYVEDGETLESPPFSKPVGEDATVSCGDARAIDTEDIYDAVLTDPPYYDNVIYSELSNFFYVWQKVLLESTYPQFEGASTPRAESIVANPAENKDAEVFESEIKQAFESINTALKDSGVFAFTYHHSESESWGELLSALCDTGFEVTAAYPISADIQRAAWQLIEGGAVSFDIVLVARPAGERAPISWNSLRRRIYRTARDTRERLRETQSVSEGDIGVIEMGECFHEYSKHHGKVTRAGETMSPKEVVQGIYGVLQEGSSLGEIDVFLDLLAASDPTYDDLNKLSRGTSADPERMKELRLYRQSGGDFILGTWRDDERMAYIQSRVNGEGDSSLNALDKAQFLRYRFERGESIQNYLSKWKVDDELRGLCEGLAEATGDVVYTRILGGEGLRSFNDDDE
ncbi:DUF1156 domain-containing protein [Halosegnis marinus]|uniref:DUF1156 domain-containing protein n=1 Tax=Halosegnis marinus TaxID=3034023 RepID=A0ABD5ZTA4_9EURY|nr:DUF1156 domain-containing protein [Halosegnis sp. DT85]